MAKKKLGNDPCLDCRQHGLSSQCCIINCPQWYKRKAELPIMTACQYCKSISDCRPDLNQ